MHKQLTFKNGLALMAMSLMFFTSCKKEEITSEKPAAQSENHELKPHAYKFSAIAQIPGENSENGFLSLKVSSDDETFLKEYMTKLAQCKISFKEPDLASEEPPASGATVKETPGVSLDFDWTNFNYHLPKGKIYECLLVEKENTKGLILISSWSSVTNFSTTGAFACVNVYNTYNKFYPGCLCKAKSKWTFSNPSNSLFYVGNQMAYHENLEMRVVTAPGGAFGSYQIPSTSIYYRPRYNFSGPELPSGSSDYNYIKSGGGIDMYTNVYEATADLRLYIAS